MVFTCTVSTHHTYVDILKESDCSSLSKVMGYALILTISLNFRVGGSIGTAKRNL